MEHQEQQNPVKYVNMLLNNYPISKELSTHKEHKEKKNISSGEDAFIDVEEKNYEYES